MVTQVRYPVAPAVTPRRGTLLQTATVTDDFAWLDGRDLFESYNEMSYLGYAEFCAPNNKELENRVKWVNGFQFAAYGGMECALVGTNVDEALAETRRTFEIGESTGVERALMETRFRDDTLDPANPRWDPPYDITPSGNAVKPGTGIALLEGMIASLYVGMPTLHLPITVASAVLGVDGATVDGDTIRTRLGSKVVAGAGYEFPNRGPDGAAPTNPLEFWVYATGEVLVGRGESNVRVAVDEQNNHVWTLAERPYIAAVDGPVVAVRVRVE